MIRKFIAIICIIGILLILCCAGMVLFGENPEMDKNDVDTDKPVGIKSPNESRWDGTYYIDNGSGTHYKVNGDSVKFFDGENIDMTDMYKITKKEIVGDIETFYCDYSDKSGKFKLIISNGKIICEYTNGIYPNSVYSKK